MSALPNIATPNSRAKIIAMDATKVDVDSAEKQFKFAKEKFLDEPR